MIGYRFRDRELLVSALKHRSIIFETGEDRSAANERLEFLGDAVLDLVTSEQLYRKYPKSREGHLTKMKSAAVSGRQLAEQARNIGLGEYLQISAGEVKSGGRLRKSIIEDALEAVIGAIYLDGGLKPAKRFIHRFITPEFDGHPVRSRMRNYKSILLEYVQGRALDGPIYLVVEEEGPDHAKIFHIEVIVDGRSVGRGSGLSKKQAEQRAAKQAARYLGITT